MIIHKLLVYLEKNLQGCEYRISMTRIVLCITLNTDHALLVIRPKQWWVKKRLPIFPVSKVLFWFSGIKISKDVKIGHGYVDIGLKYDLYVYLKLILSHVKPQVLTQEKGVFKGGESKAVGILKFVQSYFIGVPAVDTKVVHAYGTAVEIPARVINIKIPETV